MKHKLLIIIILCLLTTGCYNYRELNDLAIISAIGIEKEENNFKLTVQVLDTENTTSEEKNAKYVLYELSGNTIQEALRSFVSQSSKRLFINQLQLLIIDEKLAKDGINDIIDFFFREPESRKQYNVLLASDDIKKILSSNTLLNSINGTGIKQMIKTNALYLNSINEITFAELIGEYINPNKEILISKIDLNNENVYLSDTGVFDSDKLIGYISKQDMIYYNIINNNLNDTLITIINNDKHVSYEIIKSKADIKTKKNNIEINVKIEVTINDINYNLDLTNNNNIKKLEKELNDYLEYNIKNSITNTLEKYNSDIYGFKDLIYKNDYSYFENNDIYLNNLNINVNCKANLSYKGNGVDIIHEKN